MNAQKTVGHTPGPWTYARWDEHGTTRFYVSQQDGAPYTPDFSDTASLIADTVVSERVAIQEANARLIAAAPDLLAALIDILKHGTAGDRLRGVAAIKKATGAA